MKFNKIYIEITNYCNLNCSFCSRDDRIKHEMTIEEFKHIINEIKNYTESIYLHVKGEPLLHSKLDEILSICDENNLQYFAFAGTGIGAVRHKVFIPWDDDMDIAMPRDDYEKFLKLWGNDIHNECRLFHQSTYKKYYLTFAKVIFTGKCRFSSLIRTGLRSMNEVKGPGIDIFPLDETGPISAKLLKRASDIRKYRNILLTKVYYIKSPQKRKQYRFAAHFMTYKSLHKKLTKLYTQDHGKGEQYITNFGSAYNVTKEIFPKDYFEPAREIEFEGITVTIPNKAEEALTHIYGDFMTPPPVNMRVCPHQYIVKKKK